MNSRLAVAVLVAILLSVQATAQNRPQRQGAGRMMDQLNLTDEQQKQFDALASEFRKAAIDERAHIAKARVELLDLLKAEKLDQATITKQINTIAGLEAASKAKALDHWFSVNNILTPEQQKIWKKGLARMAQRGMAERQMRGARAAGRSTHRPVRPFSPPR